MDSFGALSWDHLLKHDEQKGLRRSALKSQQQSASFKDPSIKTCFWRYLAWLDLEWNDMMTRIPHIKPAWLEGY